MPTEKKAKKNIYKTLIRFIAQNFALKLYKKLYLKLQSTARTMRDILDDHIKIHNTYPTCTNKLKVDLMGNYLN